MNFTTTNKKVACTPFPTNQIKSKTERGIAMVEQTIKLTPLTVLHPCVEGLQPGLTVYVKGEAMKHKWATDVYTHKDGNQFILVPLDDIVAIEEADPKVEEV